MRILIAFLVGGLLVGAQPDVTPVAGPSWLKRVGALPSESSMGRGSGRYGPGPEQRPTAPPRSAPLTLGQTVALTGADLYRLNCQACHRAEGTGSPPEIKAVLGLVESTSLEVVRQHLQQQGRTAAAPAARASADRARADLYRRIQKGGERMPPLAHLTEADIDVLYAYLTQLAHVPDARPQSQRRVSFARLGELVVKGTCHICHDAVGPRPSGAALLGGAIPPLSAVIQDKPVAEFIRKVRTGAPVMMGELPLHYRGRMPVFHYLQDQEIAAAYMFLVAYPPQPGAPR